MKNNENLTNLTYKKTMPRKQGLYDPIMEHDACGIGFIVNIKGNKSHQIIEQGIKILDNLTHRGGVGCEENTGDGAGMLTQIPHKFFVKVCEPLNIKLPSAGQYGVGMMFMPNNAEIREKYEKIIKKIIQQEDQVFLGERELPVDPSTLGTTAKSNMPFIKQVFIGKSDLINDELAFERKLYVIRRQIENEIKNIAMNEDEYFYFASLSCRTIVYKGMLTPNQVDVFYKELADKDFESALALVHSRYSTNTFPSWERSHPYRYIIHNGEINTLRGNVNWMQARQAILQSDLFGEDIKKLFPIIDNDGSDSAMFDNTLEFLALSGYSLPHAAMMMIPEPWSNHESMSDEKKAFYEYYSCLMEPWDGPASVAFTDGSVVGAILDRNGLRPSRYYVTKDNMVITASEVGVLDIDPQNILVKGRLQPGRMLLIDTKQGRIITDEEIKATMSEQYPYREWIDQNMITLDDLPDTEAKNEHVNDLICKQKQFGYTFEDLNSIIAPMVKNVLEPTGAMGYDVPIAVLSKKPQLLYTYFKQLFAQVTNPPIDAIREEIITATYTMLGESRNILSIKDESCKMLKLAQPIIKNEELQKIKEINIKDFQTAILPIIYRVEDKEKGLNEAIDELFVSADKAISKGANILVLSDRNASSTMAPIPALLATAALHHYLIRNKNRTKVSIVVETGEAREVHHFALLLGYGASAINPYLAFESINDMVDQGMLVDFTSETAQDNYIKASKKGIVKILSKMGISTIQSYQGAQIFEAIGISDEIIDKYFTRTPSRIGGIGMAEIAQEIKMRHDLAYNSIGVDRNTLESGGQYRWITNGEEHMFNPDTVAMLQQACRTGDYELFRKYSRSIVEDNPQKHNIRGLMKFKDCNPIPIDEVESVEEICKRFKSGAMSFGAISKEAHETLTIAMNRIGGKSNSGEGGEDSDRYKPLPNGDSMSSATKQVASGRFGVTGEYLVNAKEIQIKMAQGAKPGEGGQLPGKKVYPWVAKVRYSTPGVELISPPPHHDIYSIEDLAELIHDLKNANENAKINVKLVSEVGVGTVAAGVAKGRADVVLISGYDGGTGAAPKSSMRHTGLPWELGIAETHQTLVLNNLRSRITVEVDGRMMNGRDVAIAALLGAEEYGFCTVALIAMGCVMMRVCNLDTCPVGIATQNPKLRAKFTGKPEHVINLMYFIAMEMREIMAMLGFRTINEMIGRTDKLELNEAAKHWKSKNVDISSILYKPEVSKDVGTYCQIDQYHQIEKTLDKTVLLDLCKEAIDTKKPVKAEIPIRNINRVAGTILGSEISRKYGSEGLPEDTITLKFNGSAGQSFGAFVPKGVTMIVEGDTNDYLGKGLSGGKIIVYPSKNASFIPEENIIIGNVAFYGATRGEAYIRGMAGERFCVRNSGVEAVVESLGDHGCEYMTGGSVVVLGQTGRNFAAGMSGGIAYVLDADGDFLTKCNMGMIEIEKLSDKDEEKIKDMVYKHIKYTGSDYAKSIMDNWAENKQKFIKIIPKMFKKMMIATQEAYDSGLTGEEALLTAFNNVIYK